MPTFDSLTCPHNANVRSSLSNPDLWRCRLLARASSAFTKLGKWQMAHDASSLAMGRISFIAKWLNCPIRQRELVK